MNSKATPPRRAPQSGSSAGGSHSAAVESVVDTTTDQSRRPDSEVPERARRRTFTAKYKLEILAAYDAASEGEKGALLRREGLYSSHISVWRQARDGGALAALTQPRGRKPRDPQSDRIAELEAEKRRLEQDLATARAVMDVQAKLHVLLETISESTGTEPRAMR